MCAEGRSAAEWRCLRSADADKNMLAKTLSVAVRSRCLRCVPMVGIRYHGTESHDDPTKETVTINWIRRDGSKMETKAYVGSNLLRTAQRYELEIEGACEGVCACSTCHCILEPKVYDSLPEPSEKEEDMLDLAFGLTPTSRLGCQVEVTKDMDGITIKLPKATRNFYVVSDNANNWFGSTTHFASDTLSNRMDMYQNRISSTATPDHRMCSYYRLFDLSCHEGSRTFS